MKRTVLTLTVSEYEAAKRREAAASLSSFKYNVRTETLSVDFAELIAMVKASGKSKRVCRPSEKVFTADDLN